MLVVFGGLPASGKTTIAKALAVRRAAVYVRVDAIEHALHQGGSLGRDVGPMGYVVAFAVASSNLRLGNTVVADSVNPVPESRQGWRDAARQAGAGLIEVEIICSDEREHRRRAETRSADIVGLVLPSWSAIKAHPYAPWREPRLVIDSARLGPGEAVAEIEARIAAASGLEAPERRAAPPTA